MAKVFSENITVAIDIGTTKICVLVAKQDGSDIQILGIGKSPSHGLKKGIVVDISKTVDSIKAAVKEAEFISGHIIEAASIGISGSHIQSFNSNGAVPIRKGGQVKEFDITNVIASAKAVVIPEGQQILHILPQYFSIDSQEKLHNPLGMFGVRLEAQVHIITGSVASVQNLVKCCEMAGVKVTDIILEQLASADAVLSQDERELGVGVLDIGGGTADFALYYNNSIRHTKVIPIAGNHFTNDIAIGLQTTIQDAERIKQRFGIASSKFLMEDISIEIEMAQGEMRSSIQRSFLVKILESRAQELINLVNEEVKKYNLKSFMTTGLVLTGGGSLLNGMKELAEDIFKTPVRIGSPKTSNSSPEALNNPMYSTAYGLLLQNFKKQNQSIESFSGPLSNRIFQRMKSWISDFF